MKQKANEKECTNVSYKGQFGYEFFFANSTDPVKVNCFILISF